MKATAKLRNCHLSARKMRLVADLVRGLPVDQALNTLQFTKKEASVWIEKCLLSAISNWENKVEDVLNQSEDADDSGLYISEIFIDEGGFIKRFRPAPHGRAHRIRKRSCHINLTVQNKIELPGESAWLEEPDEVVEMQEEVVNEESIENQDN